MNNSGTNMGEVSELDDLQLKCNQVTKKIFEEQEVGGRGILWLIS